MKGEEFLWQQGLLIGIPGCFFLEITLLVLGLKKVKGVALLFARAHNLMRAATLAPELVGIGTGTSAVPQMAG